ncbi:MAG: heterodisulfide reductase subunit A, partial [Pseudomonadota bacterium]
RYEKFYKKIKEDPNTFFIKGKVAEVSETPSGEITVVAENAVTGEKIRQDVDLVVLATGMQPSASIERLPADLVFTEEGFIVND